MRKWNAILSLTALILLLVHGILGSFQLIGPGSVINRLPWIALDLITIHAVLGIKYTVDSLRAWKKSGAGYFRENRIFWARRISGFAVFFFLFFHTTAFGTEADGVYRLQWFTQAKLVLQLLLVASVAVHIITNIRPLMISLGVKGGKKWLGDILFILSVLLLFMAAAFVIYYLRWNVW